MSTVDADRAALSEISFVAPIQNNYLITWEGVAGRGVDTDSRLTCLSYKVSLLQSTPQNIDPSG